MSEANAYVASTSSINQRNKLIKYDTEAEQQIQQLQQTQSTNSIIIKEDIEDARTEQKDVQKNPTIFARMTREQAVKNGVLDLFNKYDSIETDGKISDKEYARYRASKYTGEGGQFSLDNEEFLNSSAKEQFTKMLETSFKELGISEEVTELIKKLKTGEKKDPEILLKEQFGIDLSQCKTEEEKLKLFQEAINKRYAFDLKDTDSLYAKHYARIASGDYTVEEQELHGELDPEQIAYYAELATRRDAMVELAGYFAESNQEGQMMLVKSIGTLDKVVQTGIIGAAIYSADDKETRHNYAKLIANQDLNLTASSQMLLRSATLAFDSNLTMGEMMELISRRENYDTAAAQTMMFKETDSVERAKVSAGLITQEQYDNNYATVYAGTAYKLEEAADAYKFVIDNANDNNRTGTMNTLASNAYKIDDASQRDGAINNIKSSEYYTTDVMKALDKSYVESISNGSNKNNVSAYTNPITNDNMLSFDFINKTNNVIENGTEAEISQYVRAEMKDIDTPKGTTKQRRDITRQQGLYILSKLISQGKIQGSPYEGYVINKLSALPPQTLVNMYLSANSKVQSYFDKNNLVSPLWVAMNAPDSAIKNMNETMQEKVYLLRGEQTQKAT